MVWPDPRETDDSRNWESCHKFFDWSPQWAPGMTLAPGVTLAYRFTTCSLQWGCLKSNPGSDEVSPICFLKILLGLFHSETKSCSVAWTDLQLTVPPPLPLGFQLCATKTSSNKQLYDSLFITLLSDNNENSINSSVGEILWR